MIPNLISLSRIIIIFPIIYFLFLGNYYLSFSFFLIGGLSDFLDGYVARRINQESLIGESLDLLADKLFVCILLIFISFHFDNFIFLLMTIFIVSRELTVGIFRQFQLSNRNNEKVKVNFFGKIKTFLQIFSIGFSILFIDSSFKYLAESFIILSALVSWLSFLNYFYAKK